MWSDTVRDRSNVKGRERQSSSDGDDDRSLLSICHSPLSHGGSNNWIFVAHRPISADTTSHHVKQDGATNHSCCPARYK